MQTAARTISRRSQLLRGLLWPMLILFVAVVPPAARAALLLETAPQGTTNGGTSILSTQFLGARFELAIASHIDSIGGHFKGNVTDDRSLFLALVGLDGPTALPSLADLSSPIAALSFVAPFNDVGPYPYQVADTVLQVDLDLSAGTYALIVGSGLFGATGSGWMPVSGPIQVLPWFVARNAFISDDFRNLNEQPVRFLITGEANKVPEPGSLTLALLGLVCVGSAAARPRNRRRRMAYPFSTPASHRMCSTRA